MARRKPLSAELDPSVRQLVTELRRLADHGELSMRQLAAKTGYSQKSWERYLGGRSLPPREAVEALARIGGADPAHLLALHELATDTWTSERTPAPITETATETTTETGTGTGTEDAGFSQFSERSLRVTLIAGAVALVLAASSATLLAVRLHGNGTGTAAATAPPAPPVTSTSAPASPPTYTCRIVRTDGLWYAGISRTRNAEIGYGSAGPDVAEAQCLLRRAGISPGGIDGMFGPLTQRAVKALQKRSGLDVDGMVGPHTWKALRA
ncbi:Helix-turn-helix domain-containing protein [Streptomyces sp. yr375]|uniref:peptidoglycan-binding protein n=1 Tax=Streptomyces sp. yr375 TaxID=1761906 RepID=UPI0008C76939|nr:peptidoglycan-binding protein [Streptomyces sp. yr375]SES48648.1 Helix-turn-helix domain-containing protein [Streptomyces sp. yr375]